MRLALTWSVSAAVALIFLYVESYTLHIVEYKSAWVFWTGVALYTFVIGTLLALLRKSSSLLFYLTIVIVCGLTDLWLQANFRDVPARASEAWWSYVPGNFISAIPVPGRFFVAWSFDGIIQGRSSCSSPGCLRASFIRRAKQGPSPRSSSSRLSSLKSGPTRRSQSLAATPGSGYCAFWQWATSLTWSSA
jgi:hypothetical protein